MGKNQGTYNLAFKNGAEVLHTKCMSLVVVGKNGPSLDLELMLALPLML